MVNVTPAGPSLQLQVPSVGWKAFVLSSGKILHLHPALVVMLHPLGIRYWADDLDDVLNFYLQTALSKDLIYVSLGCDVESGVAQYREIFTSIFGDNLPVPAVDVRRIYADIRETWERQVTSALAYANSQYEGERLRLRIAEDKLRRFDAANPRLHTWFINRDKEAGNV